MTEGGSDLWVTRCLSGIAYANSFVIPAQAGIHILERLRSSER